MKPLHSLWTRITFIIVLLVLGIMISVSYFFSYRELKTERFEVRERMERIAKQIASIRFAETEGWYVYQNYINNLIRADFNKDIVYIAIFNEFDSLAAYSLNTDWLELDESRPLSRAEEQNIVRRLALGMVAEESKHDLDSVPVQIHDAESSYGTVDVGFSLVELNDAVARKRMTNFLLLAVFTAIGVVASAAMSYRIVDPLRKLSSAMLKVSDGDLSREVHVKSKDEVGELARTYNFMLKGLREKDFLEQFSRELGFTFELVKVVKLVTERIVSAVSSGHGILMLAYNREGRHALYAKWDSIVGDVSSRDFWMECPKGSKGVSTTDPMPADCFLEIPECSEKMKTLLKEFNFSANAVILPLPLKDDLAGIILLELNSANAELPDDEKRFLSALAGQAALAIDNARLYEELTEQERLKKEIEIARNIQKEFLPQEDPSIPSWQINGICIPATEFGGDYFDYFQLNNHKLGVVIADVTGKGTSAAFYMAQIKGMMLSLSTMKLSPKDMLCELNRKIYRSMDPRVFANMIYAEIDMQKNTVAFARAGHDSIMLKRHNETKVQLYTPKGLGLGLTGADIFDVNISEQKIEMNRGDTLVMYTDGITEAMNKSQEEFGEEALINIIQESDATNVQQLRTKIMDSVTKFVGDAEPHDDITMIIIRKAE